MAILDGLSDFVARILSFFYSLPVVGGNYGYAIILLTLTIMILLMPLTLKATRSTIKMQQIQPELRRVQKEFKHDREQLNAEMMKLYSTHGINPVGGCLPMIAQLPVFLVLFRILQGLTRRIEDQHFFTLANRIREARGLEPVNGRFFDPSYVREDTQLYQDLRTHTEMTFGPFDLAVQAMDIVRTDFVRALPYIVLILIMTGLSFYQQRQIMARRPGDTGELSPMLQQQQQIMKFLPLMTGVWSFFFPAGLVVYWTTSSIFRIGQQAYISRRLYGPAVPRSIEDAADDASPKAIEPAVPDPKETDGRKQSDRKRPKAASPMDGRGESASHLDAADGGAVDDDQTAVVPTSRQQRIHARQAEWEKRRKESGKRQASKALEAGSSRVTPKGTRPGTNPNRNKHKKKR
jgi:YidC/Oxa1 family membrane protein insertase